MKATRVVQRVRFDPKASIPPGLFDGRSLSRPWILADETFPADAPSAEFRPDQDELEIAWISGGTALERDGLRRGWASLSEAGVPVRFESNHTVVEWSPGRAVIQSPGENRAEFLTALADFDFLERRLRRLESALIECEASTETDVDLAFAVRFRDRNQWRRLTAKIETCTRLRLAFVQVRPTLGKGAPGLSPEGKRLAAALRRRAQIEYRLDGFCERLEACEDLYEGAHDRIRDYRWYLGGHFLEVTIIALLAAEALLMWLDLRARH